MTTTMHKTRSNLFFLFLLFTPIVSGCVGGKLYRIALSDVPSQATIVVLSPTSVEGYESEPRYAHPFLVSRQLPSQWQQFALRLAERWKGRAGSVIHVPATQPLLRTSPTSALVGIDQPVKLNTAELQRVLSKQRADLVILPYYYVQNQVDGWLFIKNTNKYCPNQNYSTVDLGFLILDARGNVLARGVDFYYRNPSVILNEVHTDGGFIITNCGSGSKLQVDYTSSFETVFSMEELVQ